MTKFKSTKAAAWSLAASYLQDTLYEETGVERAIYEHILGAVVPALKRKAQVIERKHRSKGKI